MLDLKSRRRRWCVSVSSLLRRKPGSPVATGRRASYSASTIRRLCWLLNGCLLTTSLTFGQEVASHYVHEAWTIEDGLPLNGITRLLQSRDGYLWMSTFDGLARFDGQRFTVFNMSNSKGLPSNRLVDLLEGQDGSLWMLTEQLQLVHFKDGVFTAYGSEILHGDPTTLYEDPEGTLWIGASTNVVRYQNGGLVPFVEDGLGASAIVLHRDSEGSLWIGTAQHGLKRFSGGVWTTLTINDGLSSNAITAFLEDRDGTLWIGTDRGLHSYRDGVLTRLVVNGVPAPGALSLGQDATGTLWIGTATGIYRYRADRGMEPVPEIIASGFLLNAIQQGPEGSMWIATGNRLYRDRQLVFESPLQVQAFMHDHEGNLWIASNGLHRLKRTLFTVYSRPEGLVQNIYPIYEDHTGALWFGSMGEGVSRLKDGVVTTYTRADGVPSLIVLSIYEDRERNLWIGSWDGGVSRIKKGIVAPPNVENFLFGVRVLAIHQDRTGGIWWGTEQGLYRFEGTTWTRYTIADGLSHDVVRAICEAHDGTLWFGTNGGGLTAYRDGRFTPFTTDDGLSSNLIRAIYQDADSVLWIGTEGRGLNRIDLHGTSPPAPATVTVYRQQHGLFDEVIHQILEDDFDRLWMSTNRGIFWVRRAALNAFARGETARIHSTVYTERDGLRNREANGGMQSAGIKARDGRLWFPTQDGAAVVDPSDIRRNEIPPPVVIERVMVDEQPRLNRSQAVRLAAHERDFEIEYTALSFMAPENMRFRYKLEGFNEDWVEAGVRRTAFYTNVPPGAYRFQVIASNNDGVWNETGASLALTIAPYFYETRWFAALVVLALVVLGWAGYRQRVRHLKTQEQELKALVAARTEALRQEKEATERQQAEAERQRIEAERHREVAERALTTVATQAKKLKELDQAKSRFFANISHEFRTPLTLTIGPLEDLLAELHGPLSPGATEEVDVALRNARRLLRLINQILDVAKLEAGQMKLRARRADLVALLDGLVLAFSPLAERKHITFQVDLPTDPIPLYLDPDLLEKVFTNLLSNAFKFTPEGGVVRLAVQQDAGDGVASHVVVAVKDSGRGIPAAALSHIFERFYQADEGQQRLHPGTGIGLSLAKELVELHRGWIEVESQEGFGSTFRVTLRRGKDHLDPSQIAAAPEETTEEETAWRDWLLEEDRSAVSDATDAAPGATDEEDVTTILVVDDNADIRAYVRRHLEPAYRVVEASDGAQGLDAARRWLPDLVISDVMMPQMDGYALCRALKADRELGYVPVILLTAKAAAEDKIEGLEEGADDYLTKPFDVKELEARVANLITGRQRLRERLRDVPATLHASEVAVTPSDAAFLDRLRVVIEAELDQEAFGVEALAAEMGLSRGHLHRRLRDLLAQTPTDVIRRIRLERAAQLLAGRAGSISEVAYGVGFKSVSHFSKCFRDHYGLSPTAYIAQSASQDV